MILHAEVSEVMFSLLNFIWIAKESEQLRFVKLPRIEKVGGVGVVQLREKGLDPFTSSANKKGG